LISEPPQPCITHDEQAEITAFAPYLLTHMGDWEPVESISAAVSAFFSQEPSGYQAAKTALSQAIESGRKRLVRRRAKLAEEGAAVADPEMLRQMGEAILTHAYQIQGGQPELIVEWVAGEPPLRVRLDPKLSPSENAQAYFRRYRKAQRGVAQIPVQVAQVEAEEEYLDQLAHDLTLAENRPEIDAVGAALAQAGYIKGKGQSSSSSPPARPLRFRSPDGFAVWVGKNALQNEELTFRRAAPEDIWLHARGIPGAHVIVRAEGKVISERTIEWAAGLAAYYSRARNDTQVEVDVVQRRHVRHLKGGRPGQVLYRHERTLRVAPQAPPDS
jgi:predicted ribosome quality control (RQC) complex YloA/Tae2 family protein